MSAGAIAVLQPDFAVDDSRGVHCLADEALLARFFQDRDDAAFAALLARHGGLVLGVCRRILGNSTDADDAFQATFLVLVRKGAALREPERLANWLYGVAQRTAYKLRMQRVSRSKRERQAGEMHAPSEHDEMTLSELRQLLDEEINRLPEKYAAPLVLCYLEGLTSAQAAARLGWPEGSMSRRLARARELLRSRLARRGMALSAVLIAAVFPRTAAAGVPPQLAAATLEASRQVARGAPLKQVLSADTAKVVEEMLSAATGGSKLTISLAIAAIVLAGASIAWQLDAPTVAMRLFGSTTALHGSLRPNSDHAGLATTPAACGASTPTPCCSTP